MPSEVDIVVNKEDNMYDLNIYIKHSNLEYPRLTKDSLTLEELVVEIEIFFNEITPDGILFTVHINNRYETAWGVGRVVELVKNEFSNPKNFKN